MEGRIRVLEIGSKSYKGQPSYRSLMDERLYNYRGLDLEPGPNVDIVPRIPFIWPEVPDASCEVCISGQTFEHNPFFWVTICEIARVLVPGGYVCVIAPGAGHVHRFPIDCWRFYPDSWAALCALAGLELLEMYFEGDSIAAAVDGGYWRDSMVIARMPKRAVSGDLRRRWANMTAPFREGFGEFHPISYKKGPCVQDYLSAVRRKPVATLRRMLANRIHPMRVLPTYDPPND